MHIRKNSIVATLVCFSFIFGVIGCRSNGGAWYNPKSYTWHNPFQSNEAPSFDAEGTAHVTPKPSLGSQPNVTPPPGGYTSKDDEARFFAGKSKENGSVLVPQYGATLPSDGNRVASANVPPAQTTPSYVPADSYNSYGTANNYGAANNNYGVANNGIAAGYQTNPTQTTYQHTNMYHQYEQPATNVPSNQPGVYPGTGFQENGTVTPPVYQPSYTTPASAPITAAPNNSQFAANYAPFVAPENTATYGTQPATPTYNNMTQPVPPPNNGYGVPTATPNNIDPAAGFTANPSSYQYPPTTPPAGF
ncbi:MAG: hypothetical protein LBK82_15845 [Planctomycetaceae bacterium]|jgi:hypothetical protein|nr:hypothetical protein [Planctomycetaceae bacterium]